MLFLGAEEYSRFKNNFILLKRGPPRPALVTIDMETHGSTGVKVHFITILLQLGIN